MEALFQAGLLPLMKSNCAHQASPVSTVGHMLVLFPYAVLLVKFLDVQTVICHLKYFCLCLKIAVNIFILTTVQNDLLHGPQHGLILFRFFILIQACVFEFIY